MIILSLLRYLLCSYIVGMCNCKTGLAQSFAPSLDPLAYSDQYTYVYMSMCIPGARVDAGGEWAVLLACVCMRKDCRVKFKFWFWFR